MSTAKTVSFANFICKFGDDFDLLEQVEDIIIPAFLSTSVPPRKYTDTRYLFDEVKLLRLDEDTTPTLALAGRFIKDTTLTSEQVYVDGKLVRRNAQMDSSPSAIFTLILNNHKLIYYPETAHAPGLDSFRSTALHYIRHRYQEFVSDEWESRKATWEKEDDPTAGKPLKKDVLKDFPFPSLEIVALSSDLSLRQFLEGFDKLNEISIQIVRPNSELDNSGMFMPALRESSESLNAKTSKVIHSAPDGLNKAAAETQLSRVANEGNAKIDMKGKDDTGGRISGNNEQFRLVVPVKSVSSVVRKAAKKLYEIFSEQVAHGGIHLPAQKETQSGKDAIRRISNSLNE
jgi:hypothetical protein